MTLRRLLLAAAVFHVLFATALFVVGRAAVAPGTIDRDGILIAAAPDSLLYQQQGNALASALRDGDFARWRDTDAHAHVRLLSFFFVPFGANILGAEPVNLLCYLAIISLTFVIAREAGSPRVAWVAAALVALWPTFLFHTAQLLKDPLFIAGTLALVLVILTLLTRTYTPRQAIFAAAFLIIIASVVLLIRPKFAMAVFAMTLFALTLLVLKQIAQKRLMIWNVGVAIIAVIVAASLFTIASRTREASKAYPPRTSVLLKNGPTLILRPSRVEWKDRVTIADRATRQLDSARNRFIRADVRSRAGSGLDATRFRSPRDVIAYLPRAAAIGLWSPFPNAWLASGQRVGSSGRLLAGLETLAIYMLQLLAIVAIVLRPNRLRALFLTAIAMGAVTALGLVVTNAGTLYRFRYAFWFLLIIAGLAGAEKLLLFARARRGVIVAIACLFLSACTHSPANVITLRNFTGIPLEAIYLAPTNANDWEENLLESGVLHDGSSIDIRFDPRATDALWDLRMTSGPYESRWLRLERAKIQTISLTMVDGVAIAELEAKR